MSERDDSRPTLTFDHNVVEHLGVKLYQNKPGSVLAEVDANSWDADATEVRITSAGGNERFISIADNGVGMDFQTIKDRYLVIGKPKRSGAKVRSAGGRGPMGRKGIGKLAPFGIARTVDVVTCAGGRCSWFTLDLDEVINAGATQGSYEPSFTLEDVTLENATFAEEKPADVQVFLEWIRSQPSSTGTLVRMSRLTANDVFGDAAIASALVSKFTVVLNRQDFVVLINGAPMDPATTIPTFELRIPPEGTITESISGKDVCYWVGFVGSAEWAADQAGLAVFAHGKSAQDRPYFFGAKGKEVFQRYMYGVIEADWLDEFDKDLISTDRSTLDWQNEELAEFREWGRRKVGTWLGAYEAHRRNLHLSEAQRRAEAKRVTREMASYSKH